MKTLAVILLLFFGLWAGYEILTKEPTGAAVSPSAEFNLTQQEIEGLKRSANDGDCRAAYRLAKYHNNFTLKADEAIRWYRLAVKCPEENPKLELIALLNGEQDPARVAEIERLIREISKTDPAAAKRAEAAVSNTPRSPEPARR